MKVSDNFEMFEAETKFYDETFDIEMMNDFFYYVERPDEYPDLGIVETDGDWQIRETMIDLEGGEDGYAVAQCLIAQPWEQPEKTEDCDQDECDQEFGWFEIISGGQIDYYETYENLTDESRQDYLLIDESNWWAEYREPEEASKTEVQVLGQFDLVQNQVYNDSLEGYKTGTFKQSIYVGYEIAQDIDTSNIMGIQLVLDLPSHLAKDGAMIVQTIQYRKEHEYEDLYTTVWCKVVVGDADKTEVTNYKSDVYQGINGETSQDDAVTYDTLKKGEEFY